MSSWRRALRLALRPAALAEDTATEEAALAKERGAQGGVLWRAGLIGIGVGLVVCALGVVLGRWLEGWLRRATDGGWDFWMNVEHDLPWIGVGLGAIFLLTGVLRLLAAAFPKLLGASRGAAAVRILLVAALGAGLFVLGAVLLQDLWSAI